MFSQGMRKSSGRMIPNSRRSAGAVQTGAAVSRPGLRGGRGAIGIDRVNRRTFLARAAAATATAMTAGRAARAAAAESRPTTAATTKASNIPDDLVWHDVRDWGVEGRAFREVESYFDRLPA